MTQNSATLAGNITKFQIFKATDSSDISVDMIGACVELKYYESVLSNTISVSAVIVETGFTNKSAIFIGLLAAFRNIKIIFT